MLTVDQVAERREVIAASPDLVALREKLAAKFVPVLERDPAPPAVKALLSRDGGICPDDGSPLDFDPWQPDRHRCSSCGKTFSGDRHHRRWAWYQHLWLGERMVQAAALAALGDSAPAAAWAGRSLARYGRVYFDCPNQDNVLGPARLFFSTYLESIWLSHFVAAAFLLREAGCLDREALEAADTVIEEAANLIGEFDEGLSNRQTWNNAALAAAAVWFEDADLAQRAITAPRGLVGHLADGFLPDGLWYEGEHYHLFALRGLMIGAGWARLAGVDLFEARSSLDRLAAALRAPILTALPDGSIPARQDSRFGVAVAQPMYLEIWEAGLAELLAAGRTADAGDLGAWLRACYDAEAPPAERFDAYLHEAGEPPPARRARSDLSAWMLSVMAPALPGAGAAAAPGSVLLADQGLAILRHGDTYVSLECGPGRGGHGHPDRLHLTVHSGGVHWCPDPGTGSYVNPDLFWYRSTLAHNAPRLDGADQPPGDARCEAFEAQGPWGWIVGRYGGLTRTTVLTPTHLLDQLEFAAGEPHTVELPWHLRGDLEVVTPGRWEPAGLEGPRVERVERFLPDPPGAVELRAECDGRRLTMWLWCEGELLRAFGPGLPGSRQAQPFLVCRQHGRYVRFLAALETAPEVRLTGLSATAAAIAVETSSGRVEHRPATDGWAVRDGGTTVLLGGRRRGDLGLGGAIRFPVAGFAAASTPPHAVAFHTDRPPPLDGTLSGFGPGEPLLLDHEDQYRRSELPYPGPEVFAAAARLAWDEAALYLGVEVRHPEPWFRPPDAPPLALDNEPDDIHSDGLQVYLQLGEEDPPVGCLIVPEPGARIRVRPAGGCAFQAAWVQGGWRRTAEGYAVTVAIRAPGWPPSHLRREIRFDLLVNEMRPGRLRRAGQLVWSGGGGWVYLRGDRQAPERFGRVTLA
ncbi:MAG TPA: heparinase II/III family protein [Gemmatimonadales bacterium]|nr:heparinase II/III family protein [Gemmatimonadales bacterium]